MLRILAINGSLRTGSHNGALLRAAAALLPPGAELVELTGLAHLPAYSEDRRRQPAAGHRGGAARRAGVGGRRAHQHPGVQLVDPGRSSRTRWTGRRGRSPTTRCAASRPPSSERAPACSAPCGRRPSCARSCTRSARTSSIASCPCPSRMSASTRDGRLADDLLRQELGDLLDELVAGARRGRHAGEPPIALAS